LRKENLHTFSRKVKSYIPKKIGDPKLYITIDNTCDQSRKEEITIFLDLYNVGKIKRTTF